MSVTGVERFQVNTFKQPKPTTPKQSRWLLKLLAKQEIQLHLSSEDDCEQSRQSSFTAPWLSAHLHEQGVTICFFGSHTDSMLAYMRTHNLLT